MKNYTRCHSSSLRTGRFSEPGMAYVITTVCRDRHPFFDDFYNARVLVKVLRTSDFLGRTRTFCFVVMPDHLHWMFTLGNQSGLSQTVHAIKAISSRHIGTRVWQKGFYDHAVRDDSDIKPLARYIVANPLRAGIVHSLRDYSHWDAAWI
jgi:REP element-mobilizing transposase RayT